MPGSHTPHFKQLKDELHANYCNLDAGCRQYGVTATMFKNGKYLFYICALAFSTYLVEYAAVEPIIVMGFLALVISGPEGLETWLMNQGKIERNGSDDDSDT